MTTLRKLLKDETGATALEYGMIAALIAAVIIGTIASIGDNLQNAFTTVNNELS